MLGCDEIWNARDMVRGGHQREDWVTDTATRTMEEVEGATVKNEVGTEEEEGDEGVTAAAAVVPVVQTGQKRERGYRVTLTSLRAHIHPTCHAGDAKNATTQISPFGHLHRDGKSCSALVTAHVDSFHLIGSSPSPSSRRDRERDGKDRHKSSRSKSSRHHHHSSSSRRHRRRRSDSISSDSSDSDSEDDRRRRSSKRSSKKSKYSSSSRRDRYDRAGSKHSDEERDDDDDRHNRDRHRRSRSRSERAAISPAAIPKDQADEDEDEWVEKAPALDLDAEGADDDVGPMPVGGLPGQRGGRNQ